MKRLNAFITFIALIFAAFPSHAQIVCGPYSPFGRLQNPDGTWTVGTHASCQFPDPINWSHTYTLNFPSTIVYSDGVTLQFVGSAYAYIQGHHDRVGRGSVRLVTVDNATFVDPSGISYPLIKTEVEIGGYPVDQWMTTAPLAPDTVYSFSATGTDPGINKAEDVMFMNAVYRQVQPS